MLGSLTHLNFFRAALAGFLGLVAACAFAATAQAQSTTLSAARGKTINIAVVGDSVANDLGNGMENLFEHRPNVRIVKKTRFSTGLVRTDYYDWDATISKFLKRHNPDVVVVVIGGNDHQAMRIKGKRYEPFEKGWVDEYSKRVSRFMNYLKREHTQVYWVSLPPVRSDRLTKAYRQLNRIYRREAAQHGFHYLSVWDKFLVKGAYSSFGQSLEGVKRRLRKEDGMHFTEAGQVVFASYVANALGLR
jgi:hypothetical protein